MKLFVPIWSPPEGVHAGGFYRAKRMIETFKAARPYVVKNQKFDVEPEHARTYTDGLFSPLPILFQIARMLNWIWSAIAISYLGLTWNEHFDAVYVPTSEILPTTIAGWVVARTRRIPLILCNLNVRDTELWFINRWFHCNADAIITLSEALAEEIRSERIKRPIAIGTVGVDDHHLDRSEAPRFDAVFVGRHTEAKGALDLLEIWSMVCAEVPAATLTTAGSMNAKISARWRDEVEGRGLHRNVVYCGGVTEIEKWKLFSDARLCVFPSHVEGWGIVPIEAQLAGLPVVAYDLAAYEETLRMSPCVRLIPLADRRAFAAAILELLRAPESAGTARNWARQFSWDRAARQEEALLSQLVAQANQPAKR